MTETRRLVREIVQAQRDLAYLIWLLNVNNRASDEAEKLWKRLDKRLEKLK